MQEVLAYSFNLSQSLANRWVHRLCSVFKFGLKSLGHAPARLPEDVLERLANEELQALWLDAMERRIQRPVDLNVQKEYYSGKKKLLSVKNNVIGGVSPNPLKFRHAQSNE